MRLPCSECGYEFGRWTSARLATYLEVETGIKLSSSQVRRILERKKYVNMQGKVQPGGQTKPREA